MAILISKNKHEIESINYSFSLLLSLLHPFLFHREVSVVSKGFFFSSVEVIFFLVLGCDYLEKYYFLVLDINLLKLMSDS